MNTVHRPALLDERDAERIQVWRTLGERALQTLLDVAAVPAPTFDEGERAAFVADWLRAEGLAPVGDEAGNVHVRVNGREPGPVVLVTAHMDNVFSREQHAPPILDGELLRGPGVRDNAAAVAHLLLLALWWHANPPDRGSVIFAATVQEEGLGNLNGMHALMKAFDKEVDAVIVIDGNLGWLIHAGVGSKRWKVSVGAKGGHSWLDAGEPSAIHGLVEALSACLAIKRSSDPSVTFNIGTVSGGTSVNAIASRATALLDLRSVSDQALYDVASQIEETLQNKVQGTTCTLALEIVGQRPGGLLSADHPYVAVVGEALSDLGIKAKLSAASTEANVPLSMGIPAVGIGSAVGYGMHTTEEYLETATLVPGLCQVGLVIDRVLHRQWRTQEDQQHP